jgi:TonB family protein
MNNNRFELPPNRLWRTATRLMQATALALMVALAMPAWAANIRAIKSRIPPVYPVIAQRMRITGVVKLSVTVNAEGNVIDVKILSGNRALSEAADEAVHKWKFETGGGTAIVEVNITFAL